MSSFEKFTLVRKEDMDRLRQHDMRTYDPKMRALVQLDQEMQHVLSRRDISAEEKMAIFQQAQHRFMSLFNNWSATAQHAPAAAAAAAADEDDEDAAAAAPVAAPEAHAPGDAAEAAHGADEFILPTLRAHATTALLGATTASAAPPALAQATAAPSIVSFVKDLRLPTNRHDKALSLIENIQKQAALISYDHLDRLVLNGHPLPGSKFSDLFRELYIHSQEHNLTAQPEFMTALRNLHIKPTAISNSLLLPSLKLTSSPPKHPTPSSSHQAPQTGKGQTPGPPGKKAHILRIYRI